MSSRMNTEGSSLLDIPIQVYATMNGSKPPNGLKTRTVNILRTHGFSTLRKLLNQTEEQFQMRRNVGRATLHEIKSVLEYHKLQFKKENQDTFGESRAA